MPPPPLFVAVMQQFHKNTIISVHYKGLQPLIDSKATHGVSAPDNYGICNEPIA